MDRDPVRQVGSIRPRRTADPRQENHHEHHDAAEPAVVGRCHARSARNASSTASEIAQPGLPEKSSTSGVAVSTCRESVTVTSDVSPARTTTHGAVNARIPIVARITVATTAGPRGTFDGDAVTAARKSGTRDEPTVAVAFDLPPPCGLAGG